MVKEKEALEASLTAISGQGPTLSLPGDGQDEDKGPAASSTTSGSQKGEEDNDTVSVTSERSGTEEASLEAKVRTLAASLATLTAEKSRLESSFQEDRRRTVQEKRERERTIEALHKEMAEKEAKVKVTVEDLKSKLIVEKHSREAEMSDHALMIRELQKLLSDERRTKEKLENDLHEAKAKILTVEHASANSPQMEAKVKEAEAKLKSKSDQVAHVRVL